MRAVIYARKSISDRNGNDESGSITEQLESGRHHAAAQGWTIVGEFVDDGVSAGEAPEDRDGWRALLARADYDRVIVRHIDRLSRRLLDFLKANEVLDDRGAGLVSIRQHIDMSSPTGRLFANVLASFSEYERELIRERVSGTRRHLQRSGRAVGGTVPFGWRNVPIDPVNPRRGKVLARDPETIDFVRGMVKRTLAGHTLYSTVQWLDESGAPTPGGRGDSWRYSTVERIVRHPILAGLTPFNPDNDTRQRGEGVLLGADGLPVVNEAVAVMPLTQWRAMLRSLDERDEGRRAPRALRAKTSALLSGLVQCGEHDEPVRMHRGTTQGRPGYHCPKCHQSITGFEEIVVEEFLAAKGEHLRWRVVEEVHEGKAAFLPEIEHQLARLSASLQGTDDDDEADRLTEEIRQLRRLRRDARAEAPVVTYRQAGTDRTFAEDWDAAGDDVVERRAVLDDSLGGIVVRRGRQGRRTRAQLLARLRFDWRGEVGPMPVPDETWLT